MQYQLGKRGGNAQLTLVSDRFVVTFEGREQLKELIKYAKIALKMQDGPRDPRGNFRVVK